MTTGVLGQPMMGTDPKTWKWVQVAKLGSFRGHASGAFRLTGETFDEIVRNFKADDLPLQWDFEHASEQSATAGTVPTSGTPAQGWIHDLENRGPAGLWALTEWGELARDYIRTGKYKFCSPAIRFGCKDRETGVNIGARLSSVALTGSPFLTNMEMLAAKDQGAGGAAVTQVIGVLMRAPSGPGALVHQTHEYIPAIKSALKLHELSTHEEMSDKLDRLRECCLSAGPHGVHEGVNLSEYTAPLRDIVGAKPGMTVEELFDQVQDLIDAAIEEHVEEYHEAPGASMSTKTEGASAASQTTGDAGTEPSMPTEAEFVALKDQHTTATSKIATLEAEKVQLTTKVGELTTKVTELSAKEPLLAAKDGEIVALKSDVTAAQKRATDAEKALSDMKAADEDRLVTARHLAYKDKKPMAKEAMLVLLRSGLPSAKDPKVSLFDEEFPPIDAAHAHLLREVTPPEKRPDVDQPRVTIQAKALEIQKAKGLTYAAALIEAEQVLAV